MDMEVVGRHALLFDDDASAAFVNSGDALVEWHSLNIDRYDVRHLLSAPPPPRRRSLGYEPRTSDDPAVEFLIDQERYFDLPLESDQPELEKEEDEEEEAKPSNSSDYRSVAFSYGDTGGSANQENTDGGMEASGYLPPFPVPRDIVHSLPPSEKVHLIIARTAIFVSKHGGQTEIILRVKQGDNPTFGFLMPDHHLHAYFRYLVENPELLHTEIDEKSQDERKVAGTEQNNSGNVGGALSLLGSIYGSGEDEEGDDAVNISLSHDAQNIESVETAAKDESVSGKTIPSKRDKVPAIKKNASIIGSKPKGIQGIKKEDNSGLASTEADKLRNHGIGISSKPILEPPPELKRLIDKVVEFVMRNGRQFEATLLEQDIKLERFSFLLSSNQYHPYYLKALEAGQESKVNGKIFKPGQDVLGGRGTIKKASLLKENDDVPFDSDRKEKFKMVIGKSKKEAQETEKESQESGFTVDAAAAAAILQAATKGIKSSGLRFISNTGSNSHDNVVRNEDGQPANRGSLQPLGPYITNEKAMAGTASHGVALEADTSNRNLTEEQKLKAERLKRAKMFVAMLKSGALPSRTGTSRDPSAEPVEPGVLNTAGESTRDQETENSLAPAVLDGSSAKFNFVERQNERQSKRKYRSSTIGTEDDELDSYREGRSIRKHRSRSRRPEDDDDVNAVKKEHRYCQERKRHRSHSTEGNKNEGESSEENKDHKPTENDDSEREDKDNEHQSERKYKSKSRRRNEDAEVGNAVGKDRKHRRKRHRSHSSPAESVNGEESDVQDTEHKHYKSKHSSRSHHDNNEDRDKEHRRSYGSRSRRHGGNKRSSHSYDETGGEDRMDLHHSKSSHSKQKDDSRKDVYKEEKKDRKRSRKCHHSHHSSSESPDRHSSEQHKKHRSSHKHKHTNMRSSKDTESRRYHKHNNSSSDDDNQHHVSSSQPGKESHYMRDELEEGEISTKLTLDESKGTAAYITTSEQRVPSPPSETTEVPADLRAKIRAMLMAARS